MVLWEPKNGKRGVGGRARTFVDLLEADIGVPRDCLAAAGMTRVAGEREQWEEGGERGGEGFTEVDLVVVAVVVVSCSRSSSSSSSRPLEYQLKQSLFPPDLM